jgi:2-polyprenyl-6-methoxyphenol hydroxylase-like FAD-dependent oxidoreductase
MQLLASQSCNSSRPVCQPLQQQQVHSIKDWVMSAEVADEYAAWGNRLLLAGDAAHR